MRLVKSTVDNQDVEKSYIGDTKALSNHQELNYHSFNSIFN